MAATTISRSNIGTNDDGSGTTGTVINVAYINLLYDNIDALFSSTTGLTLNQGAGDAAILAVESSDVAHGMTSLVATGVYLDAKKYSATEGGVTLDGYSETNVGIAIQGRVTTEDATRSTTGLGAVVLAGHVKSGTTTAVMTADRNVVVIRNGNLTRFIFDSDGDAHADVSWVTFDTHDDLALLASLEGELAGRDALKADFQNWMTYNREALAASRLVTFNDDGHHFVNFTRLSMALCGAVRQIGLQNAQLADRLRAIEGWA